MYILELAKLRTSLPRERHRARIRLFARKCFGPSDRSGSVRALDRLAGRQPAINMHER